MQISLSKEGSPEKKPAPFEFASSPQGQNEEQDNTNIKVLSDSAAQLTPFGQNESETEKKVVQIETGESDVKE